MPTYEYVCRSCGHLFEIVQSMRDDPLTECPECGGELRKVFAPPAISFKGSGFYATDHAKKGSKTTGDGSGDGKGDGGKGKGTGGERSGSSTPQTASASSSKDASSSGSSSSSSSGSGASTKDGGS
jgi:putative FmdB family regulatory protein